MAIWASGHKATNNMKARHMAEAWACNCPLHCRNDASRRCSLACAQQPQISFSLLAPPPSLPIDLCFSYHPFTSALLSWGCWGMHHKIMCLLCKRVAVLSPLAGITRLANWNRANVLGYELVAWQVTHIMIASACPSVVAGFWPGILTSRLGGGNWQAGRRNAAVLHDSFVCLQQKQPF